MSFICTVCLDRLEINSSSDIIDTTVDTKDVNNDVVATRCGHIFHVTCLKNWFKSRPRLGHDCPYCKANIGTHEYQRIYPVGDEDSEVTEKNRRRAEKAVEESEGLKSEIKQLEKVLEFIGSQLEEKKMAYEILQDLLQHKSIEMESLQTEKDEQELIMTAIKKDCRQTVLSLEDKLQNALHLFQMSVKGSRDKIRSLQEEVDNLRASAPAKRSVESQTDTLPFSIDSLPFSSCDSDVLELCLKYFETRETTTTTTCSQLASDCSDSNNPPDFSCLINPIKSSEDVCNKQRRRKSY